jgi:hypothetical protein
MLPVSMFRRGGQPKRWMTLNTAQIAITMMAGVAMLW